MMPGQVQRREPGLSLAAAPKPTTNPPRSATRRFPPPARASRGTAWAGIADDPASAVPAERGNLDRGAGGVRLDHLAVAEITSAT